MSETPLPSFVDWSSFPFDGTLTVKKLDDPVEVEPPRKGEDPADCASCQALDDAYIWVNENWRVRSMDRPSGLPMVLILETRSHLDLGDLPNMLAAELGVMTVRLERAIRSLDGVARVHVNRWGDGAAHLHLWFMARPYGRLQLRGTFLTLWDEILPPVPAAQWEENLALIAAWLAEFGGEPLAKPPRIDWKAPSSLPADPDLATGAAGAPAGVAEAEARQGDPLPAAGRGEPATAAGRGEPATEAGRGEPATEAGQGEPATEAGQGEPATEAAEPERDRATTDPTPERPAATGGGNDQSDRNDQSDDSDRGDGSSAPGRAGGTTGGAVPEQASGPVPEGKETDGEREPPQDAEATAGRHDASTGSATGTA